MSRKANFAGIWEETIELVQATVAPMLLFVVLIAGLGTLGEVGGAVDPERLWGLGLHIDPGRTTAWGVAAALAGLVANVAGGYLLLVRMLEAKGRLAPGDTRIWAYVGLSILVGLGTVLGFVALIVPGVIVMVRWSAAPAFLVGERAGITEAMSMSWDATKDAAWSIFFAGLVGFVAMIALGGAIGGLAGWTDADPVITSFATGLLEAISTVVSLAFGIAVYLLVRSDASEMESVFA